MHLYQRGMDLTLVSQWLGHANLSSTLVYAYADTEMKRAAIEKANVWRKKNAIYESGSILLKVSFSKDYNWGIFDKILFICKKKIGK